MSFIVVDWEADGAVPPIYSGVCFGAVVVEPSLSQTFYGEVAPISDIWVPEALAISGFSREQHLAFEDPASTMPQFAEWVNNVSKGTPVFVSDNLAFDWQFTNYYMHRYVGKNPFGFSGRRIGDIYCGMMKDPFAKWKHLRKTRHSHHPLDDCIGNAEALLAMRELGFKFNF